MPSKWWPSKIQPSLIFWIVLVAIIVSTCNNTYVTNVLHIARIYCTRLALFNDIIFFSKRNFFLSFIIISGGEILRDTFVQTSKYKATL